MQLDAAVVRIRRRTPWQALDVGILLARHWYRELLSLWLVCGLPLLPVLALFAWLIPGKSVGWMFLLFDGFHPVLEAVLIVWAGRAMFAERLGIGQTLRVFRGLFSLRLLAALLRYRIHPLRPFAYAVLTLEQPEPGMAAPRIALLGRGQDNTAFFLFAGACITILFTCSALIAVFSFIPEELRWFTANDLVSPLGLWLLFALYAIISALMAPFMVSCGFMLYISRRVELEAWDIELGFRNLNARLQARQAVEQ